jgi:hypothetical protein
MRRTWGMFMKRKTWIILGGIYLSLVILILLVALLGKDEPQEESVATSGTGEMRISQIEATQTTIFQTGEGDTSYPIIQDATLGGFALVTPSPSMTLTPGTALPTNPRTATAVFAATATRTWSTTQFPTSTSSSGAYPVATNTPTHTPTMTKTPQTGWAGEWVAFLAQGDGTYISGILTISINNGAMSGEFNADGALLNFTGSTSNDEKTITGDYEGFVGNGWFKWVLKSNSVFEGNIDNERAFCATREGDDRPEPCGDFDPH